MNGPRAPGGPPLGDRHPMTVQMLADDKLALLGSADLFKGFAEADLRRLGEMCNFHQYEKGVTVFSPETRSQDLYLLLRGKVRIVNYSLSGREVAYATAGAGDYFGELSAIDGEVRSATVATLEPSLMAIFAQADFHDMLRTYPAIAVKLLKKLTRLVRTSNERIMDLATLSAYQRVYSELLKLLKPDPVRAGSWLIYPLPTQAAIAAQASTTRETVARVVSQLTHSGLAERKGRTLYVRDPDKLRQMTERLGEPTA